MNKKNSPTLGHNKKSFLNKPIMSLYNDTGKLNYLVA